MIVAVLAATVGLVGAGYLPARVIVRRPLAAAVLAPLMTGLLAAVAGTATVLTSSSPRPWAIASLGGANLAVVALGLRRPVDRTRDDHQRLRIVLACVLALPLLALAQPSAEFDAHSIWFARAQWYATGGTAAHEIFSNDTSWPTPDYPPLVPASAGVLAAAVGRDPSWDFDQSVTALLGYAAMVWLAWLLLDMAGKREQAWAWATGGLLVSLALCARSRLGFSDGYADFLCAAAATAGAVGLVVREPKGRDVGVPLVLLAVAMLTKNEGASVALTAIAFGAVLHRRVLTRRSWLALAAVAAVPVGWRVVVSVLGARSYLTAEGNLSRALGDPLETLGRVDGSIGPMAKRIAVMGALALVVTVVGTAAGSDTDRRTLLRRLGPLWVMATVSFAATLAVYLLAPFRLEWFVPTSVDRATLMVNGLLATIAAVGALTLVTSNPPLRSGRPDSASPEDIDAAAARTSRATVSPE